MYSTQDTRLPDTPLQQRSSTAKANGLRYGQTVAGCRILQLYRGLPTSKIAQLEFAEDVPVVSG